MNVYKIIQYILMCIPLCVYSVPQPGTPIWTIADQNESLAEILESKVCNLEIPELFSATFTAIESLNRIVVANDSQIDTIQAVLSVDTVVNIDEILKEIYNTILLLETALGEFITNADVGLTGFTISAPGIYRLCEVIDTTAAVAITIAADNVVLDFNGFSILNAEVAVQVNSGHSNVVLRNGFITNTTDNGILLEGNNSSIVITDMALDNCGANGVRMQADGANIHLREVQSAFCLTNGIYASTCTNVTLDSVLSCNNANNGIFFDSDCSRIKVKNCLTNSNGGAGTAGIAFDTCNQIEILSCSSMSNVSNSGIDLVGVTDGLIQSNKCITNAERGIRVRSNSARLNIIDNVCIQNTQPGIELNTATNCYVFENITSLNGTRNIGETAGGPNTILSNWALAAAAATNYAATTSTINSVVIDQSGTFPSEPTKWQNISMTT